MSAPVFERVAPVLDVFFGCAPEDVADTVVYTPIPAFYYALVEDADRAEEHRGWWRLATVESGAARYSVVHHFEGTRIVDPVYALAGPDTRLGFLGLAGALTPGLDIGDVVRIGSAHRPPNGNSTEIADDAHAHTVIGYTGDGLLDDVADDAAHSVGADVVDLEAYFFFQAAHKRHARSAIAMAIITDKPGNEPFWSVRLDDETLRAAALRMSADLLHAWHPNRVLERGTEDG